MSNLNNHKLLSRNFCGKKFCDHCEILKYLATADSKWYVRTVLTMMLINSDALVIGKILEIVLLVTFSQHW